MNIADAKRIPLHILVERLGGRFARKGTGHDLWYYSPFRPDEKTASFKIDERKNTWHDFARTQGLDAHGDILDLWTDYHGLPRRDGNALKQALQALAHDRTEVLTVYKRSQAKPHIATPARYSITKSGSIYLDSLKAEIARRNLSLAIVQPCLKQVKVRDGKTDKDYYGFAFPNDKGGQEISIPNPQGGKNFKTCIGKKSITTLGNRQAHRACVFEGFWDCFSWIAMKKDTMDSAAFYVMNSVTLANDVASRLMENKATITTVFLFMDNDEAGEKATNTLLDMLEGQNFRIGTMNHVYQGYKDISAYRGKI